MTNITAEQIVFSNYPGEHSSLKNTISPGRFFEEKFILLQKEEHNVYEVYVFSVGETHSRVARWLETFGYKILGGGFLKFRRAWRVGEVDEYEAFFDSSSMQNKFGYDRPQDSAEVSVAIKEAMKTS